MVHRAEQGIQGSASFLKKRSKKFLFLCGTRRGVPLSTARHCAIPSPGQWMKFFCFFLFTKRRPSFPFPPLKKILEAP
jgi:hypothetical protein